MSVIDLTTFRVIRSLPVGTSATQTIPTDKGIFVLTAGNGTVTVLGPDLKTAQSHRFADHVPALCLSPDGSSLLMTAPGSRELILAGAQGLKVNRRYKLAGEPEFLSTPPAAMPDDSPKPRYAAVSIGKSGVVQLIDFGTGRIYSKTFSGPVGQARFRADGERLLVANLQERCITALTTPDLQTIADLPLAMEPQNLCFNADQGQLFVSGEGMDAVAIVFPYSPLDVDQTVLAGRDPGIMACSADPAFLFVGSQSGSDVCIVNIDSRKMIGIVDAGQRPSYITVTPDSQYALVLAEASGTMAVIHIADMVANAGNAAKWRSKSTAGLFTLINVGIRPVHVAVVPRHAA